ncbi:MAG TPA: hypothetical protein VEZ11_03650 [Thermoanaerobaculia bacterium]|nr:hypothetical protein [Thermoanaerobaculia bacterium]
MRFLVLIPILAMLVVSQMPAQTTAAAPPPPSSSPGEFPWQLSY